MPLLLFPEDLLLVFSGFGFLQGMFLSCLLFFHPKSDRTVNIFLASFIMAITVVIVEILWMDVISVQFVFFMEPFALLLGPLLFMYVRSFRQSNALRKSWPHFLPFFFYIFVTYWFWNHDGSKLNISAEPEVLLRNPTIITLALIKLGSFMVYYFLTRFTLVYYQRSIRQLYSETSRIDLNWARWVINGYLSLVIATIILFVLILTYPQLADLWLLINVALVTPYLYIVTWKGIVQPSLWQLKGKVNKEKVEKEFQEAEDIELMKQRFDKLISQKSGLSEDRLKEIISGLVHLMENKKIYLEPELTLQQIATDLQFPSHQVSFAINDGLKKNFYDLVNGYRVEEAKKLLLDSKNKNYTVLSVGFEAGFNSKTTFNTVFKKFTGLTPTEYRDKQKAVPIPH